MTKSRFKDSGASNTTHVSRRGKKQKKKERQIAWHGLKGIKVLTAGKFSLKTSKRPV
jgi:hypothetical protein